MFNSLKSVLCCYINQTQRIQVSKVTHLTQRDIEKVIFPGERFLFEATTNAKLDIYVTLAGKTTLLDSIPCSTLQTQTLTDKTLELVKS